MGKLAGLTALFGHSDGSQGYLPECLPGTYHEFTFS
jgi:hypothetical protein